MGDHKQLPPTFRKEESSALSALDKAQEKLIRGGVIERIFENFPEHIKSTQLKQYRMLPEIGKFISKHFYNNGLDHCRTEGNGLFEHFAWLTYDSKGYFVPPERGEDEKTLINQREIQIIVDRLKTMCEQISEAKSAVIAEASARGDTVGSGDVLMDASTTVLQSEESKSYFSDGKRLSVAVITPYSA